MKKTWIALLLAAALLLCACGGAASSSAEPGSSAPDEGAESGGPAAAAELPVDETVLGTVFGVEVPYTDYRLYLDLEDAAYRDSLCRQMAINLLLDEETEKLGIAVDPQEFEDYAAMAYYNEILSEPRIIEEIAAACEWTGLEQEQLNPALYEIYRQDYVVERIGESYTEAYRAQNEQGEKTDEEYEAAAREYANMELYALAEVISARIELSDREDMLAKIDGEDVPMGEQDRAFLLLAAARNRLSIVNSILTGEAMAREMEEAGSPADVSEFSDTYREYFNPMFESGEFAEAYRSVYESRGATVQQMAESAVRSFAAMMAYEEPYYDFLSEQYEALPEAERPETFEAYYDGRYEALYEACEAVNPMG